MELPTLVDITTSCHFEACACAVVLRLYCGLYDLSNLIRVRVRCLLPHPEALRIRCLPSHPEAVRTHFETLFSLHSYSRSVCTVELPTLVDITTSCHFEACACAVVLRLYCGSYDLST